MIMGKYPSSYQVRFDVKLFYSGGAVKHECYKKCFILSAFQFMVTSDTKQ